MKRIFFLFFILLNCYLVHSQRFDGGILFGFTMSQIDGDGYAGFHQPGLKGGFYTNTELSKNIDGQLEILYTGKGARETGSADEPTLYKLKLHYIEVPVKLVYKPKKYKIDIEAGIISGYLLGFSPEGTTDDGMFVIEILDMDPLRKFEISSIVGISYHISEKLKINIAYNYSILTIRKYDNTDYNYGPVARIMGLNNGDYNNSMQFALYYQINK